MNDNFSIAGVRADSKGGWQHQQPKRRKKLIPTIKTNGLFYSLTKKKAF